MQHVYVLEINKGYALLVQGDSQEQVIAYAKSQLTSQEEIVSARPAKREDFHEVRPFTPANKLV